MEGQGDKNEHNLEYHDLSIEKQPLDYLILNSTSVMKQIFDYFIAMLGSFVIQLEQYEKPKHPKPLE